MKRFQVLALPVVFLLVVSTLFAEESPPKKLYVTFNSGAVDSLWQDSTGSVCCGIPYIDSVNRANDCTDFVFGGSQAFPSTCNDYLVTFPDSADLTALSAIYLANSTVRWARPLIYVTPHYTPNDPLLYRGYPNSVVH